MKGKLISLLVLLAVILGCQTNDVPDNKHESISIQMISEEVTLLEDGKGSIRFKVIPAEQSESVVSEYEDILHICLSDGDKDNRDMPILSCELTSDNVIETVFLITGQFPDDFYSEYICFVVIEFEDEWIVSDSIKITYQPKEDDFSEVPMYIKYSTYDGKPVDLYTSEGFGAVLISNAYDEESGIGYLNFDKHVTHVPDYAFMACTNLTSVELPESVSEIGVKAFMGCSSMQETIIPESVKKIGALAFEDCSGKLTIGCDIPSCSTDCAEAPFAKADFDEVEILEGVEKLGSGAFYECTSLERITLPNSLNNISYKAFYGCVSLVEISIPDSVVEIWKNVFENCISLETVHLPSSIDYIRDYIFKGCKRLTNIEIPSNVAAIGTGAFENCVALKKIVIPNKVFDIHDNAFCGCSSLEEIELGVRVQTIGLDAFNGCSSTKEVVVPRNVKSIGSHAFCGCTGKLVVECNIPDAIEPAGAFAYSCFETIEVADFVENVGDSAFYSCEYVTNVQLPDGLLYLGASAFAGCKRLKAIKIPRMISEIKQNVFKGCNSLESLELHDDILKIGASSFWGCGKLEEIIIPSKVEEIGNCAFAICGNLKITIPESVRFLGNQVFLDTKGELIFNCEIPDCYTDKDSPFKGSLFESVAIGDNVTRIADHLFYRSEELKSVKFGARVKSVGQCAFYQCSELEDIYFNDGLIEICRSAFAGCRALQMVSIPPTLEKLGAVAFYECSELSEVYMYPVTPPEAVYSSNSWGSFHSIKGSIYVPVGSESLYKSTEGWSFYKSKIFGKL